MNAPPPSPLTYLQFHSRGGDLRLISPFLVTAPTHAIDLIDRLGFAPVFSLGTAEWQSVPDTPGVYVLFDREETIYVGMAGRDRKGSLRRRLRDHASGQIVNMFAQYLLFDRLLFTDDPPRTPREATLRCREYIRKYCAARYLALDNKADAVRIEKTLRQALNPSFNGTG